MTPFLHQLLLDPFLATLYALAFASTVMAFATGRDLNPTDPFIHLHEFARIWKDKSMDWESLIRGLPKGTVIQVAPTGAHIPRYRVNVTYKGYFAQVVTDPPRGSGLRHYIVTMRGAKPKAQK